LLAWRLSKAIAERQKYEQKASTLLELLQVINKILRHDVLSKLARIKWSIEAVDGPADKSLLDAIHHDAEGGIERIKQMRQLESVSFGGQNLKPFHLRAVIEPIANAEKIKVRFVGDETVMADEALESVFENLIRNARIHGGVDSLEIEMVTRGNVVVVKVKDNGVGIGDMDESRMFEEGYASGATGNSGLGLYIVRKTIERYGGKVSFARNLPSGSIFILEFPVFNLK
jgi:signal transduction histidine kinase